MRVSELCFSLVMEATGYDAKMVVSHLPVFNRKWSEIRKGKWAQIFVMERPEAVAGEG